MKKARLRVGGAVAASGAGRACGTHVGMARCHRRWFRAPARCRPETSGQFSRWGPAVARHPGGLGPRRFAFSQQLAASLHSQASRPPHGRDRSRLGYLDHDLRAAYTAPFGRLRDLRTFRRQFGPGLAEKRPARIFLLWNASTPYCPTPRRPTPRRPTPCRPTPCRPTPIRPPSSASCPVRQARPSPARVKSGGAGSWWTRETSLSAVSPAG